MWRWSRWAVEERGGGVWGLGLGVRGGGWIDGYVVQADETQKGAWPLPSRANSEIATALSLGSFCAVPLRLFWNVLGASHQNEAAAYIHPDSIALF
jgi:hypothetical protein